MLPVTDSLDALFEGCGRTLTAPEVAELLGVTKQGVYDWLRKGTIPGYKLGSTWFIVTEELKETMRKGANGSKTTPGAATAEEHEED